MTASSPESQAGIGRWLSPAVARISAHTFARRECDPVVWGLGNHERDQVIAALQANDDPFAAPPRPWLAVLQRPSGHLVAASAPALIGGIYWTLDRNSQGEPELIIGHDTGQVVRARTAASELDGEYVRARLSGFLACSATTPYRNVHHIPFGITACWSRIEEPPRLTPWFNPDTLPQPSLAGSQADTTYLNAFDSVIDDLVDPAAPLASTLSGGLDSTFVVASLVRHATPDNPLHCYTHSPHPDARLQPVGNWDPDDYQFVLAMQRAYPDRIEVHRVINYQLIDPLEFVIQSSLAAWVPTFNTNGIWLAQMAADAAARGAPSLFHGTIGNAAFSFDHTYALGHYVRRADARAVVELMSQPYRQGLTFSASARSLLGPLLSPYRARKHNGALTDYLSAVGLRRLIAQAPADFPSTSMRSRRDYLAWLTRSDKLVAEPSHLAWPILMLDPFATRRMCAIAARIEPKHWRVGTQQRSFARRLGQQRVPDAIRLRTRRGAQMADRWFAARRSRDLYLDHINLLPDTPYLGGWVDHVELRRRVLAWPWNDPASTGPAGWALSGLYHVLGTAEFIRSTQTRLLG